MKEEHDFIIIGAGIAGLSAAMYSARLGMKTLCLGASTGLGLDIGGVLTIAPSVKNYPGFDKIRGAELVEKIRKQAESYDLVKIKEEKVASLEKKGERFIVKTGENEYSGKTILFATGTKRRRLDVKGGREFEGRGVAYCALCDAPLFKNKVVAVIGGSDCAVMEAMILSEHASKVYIIYRKDKLRAESSNIQAIESNKKIEVITETNITEVKGDKIVKSVVLDREYNNKKELELNGVFVAIGHVPNSELAKKMGVKLNENDEIIANPASCATNIRGVYAAGDVIDKELKQAITGAAEGCIAAHSAFAYISKDKE